MSEQFWDHCWLNINNQDWWIGQIETVWSNDKKMFQRWLRLWRDEEVDGSTQVALMSLDMARVDWAEYNRIALAMLEEAYGVKGWKTGKTTRRIGSNGSTTTKRSPKRLPAG